VASRNGYSKTPNQHFSIFQHYPIKNLIEAVRHIGASSKNPIGCFGKEN